MWILIIQTDWRFLNMTLGDRFGTQLAENHSFGVETPSLGGPTTLKRARNASEKMDGHMHGTYG